MAVQFTVLGSGSGGNAAWLETSSTRIMIDAGFSGRQIRSRLAPLGRVPESLSGILITHEHSDHIQGLAAIASKSGVPIYCNRDTRDAIRRSVEAPLTFVLFETGQSLSIGDIEVDTFAIPHDAIDPVGFLLRTNGGNLGFLTDLGHATRLVLERVRAAHVLVLEANHDLKLLQDDTRRPWSTKQRILGRHGHLSNDAAAEVAASIVHDDLRRIYLGHLSRDCNRPELARAAVFNRLSQEGVSHVTLVDTSQDSPCATFHFSDLEPTTTRTPPGILSGTAASAAS